MINSPCSEVRTVCSAPPFTSRKESEKSSFMIQDFRKLLKSELSARVAKNPKYSLRAMANRIGISASTLSDILNGKRSCSVETAEKMALFFEMSPSVKENFLNLIKFDSIKNPTIKKICHPLWSKKLTTFQE